MIFGPSGRDHDSPEPIILDFGPTKLFQIIQEYINTFQFSLGISRFGILSTISKTSETTLVEDHGDLSYIGKSRIGDQYLSQKA